MECGNGGSAIDRQDMMLDKLRPGYLHMYRVGMGCVLDGFGSNHCLDLAMTCVWSKRGKKC
jgi:hypothetical protein